MANRPYEMVGPMLRAMHAIRDDIGTDVMSTQKHVYNLIIELLCLHAMTLKIIQDLHPTVVTDAALQQRLDTAIDTGPNGDKSGWPGWILLQVPPSMLGQYGATLADSVSVLQAKIDAWNAANGGS